MHVVVTGSGPGGCASAIALAQAGAAVTLLTGPRTRPRVEGLSRRSAEALESAGCAEAAALTLDPSAWVEREVSWGQRRGANQRESLVERAEFDAALRRDADRAGVVVVETSVQDAKRETTAGARPSWCLRSSTGHDLRADYWIDARGRAAPGPRRERGPATVAITLPTRVEGAPALASALVATEDGFSWIAVERGRALVQWFRDPHDKTQASARGPRALGLEMEGHLEALRVAAGPGWLSTLYNHSANPERDLRARDAATFRAESVVEARRLRVGDAAATCDPLSGQGVFAALAMARAAVAVVCTEIGHPERAELARRFYRDRVDSVFSRNRDHGVEFYREERRWPEAVFWSLRQQHAPIRATRRQPEARMESRPVVQHGLIVAGEALVSEHYPDGVWSYEGVPIAALLDAAEASDEALAQRFSVAPAVLRRVWTWLEAQGIGRARQNPEQRLTAKPQIPHSADHG